MEEDMEEEKDSEKQYSILCATSFIIVLEIALLKILDLFSIEARSTNSVKFELPGGISLGSSKEDIIKAYGQPTTSTSENNANYHKNTESLRLYFDRNGKLTSAEYSTTR